MLYIKRSRLKTLLGGWVGGWVGGRESRVKDYLQQSKTPFLQITKIKLFLFLSIIFSSFCNIFNKQKILKLVLTSHVLRQYLLTSKRLAFLPTSKYFPKKKKLIYFKSKI
jgi:hypothetical protein